MYSVGEVGFIQNIISNEHRVTNPACKSKLIFSDLETNSGTVQFLEQPTYNSLTSYSQQSRYEIELTQFMPIIDTIGEVEFTQTESNMNVYLIKRYNQLQERYQYNVLFVSDSNSYCIPPNMFKLFSNPEQSLEEINIVESATSPPCEFCSQSTKTMHRIPRKQGYFLGGKCVHPICFAKMAPTIFYTMHSHPKKIVGSWL